MLGLSDKDKEQWSFYYCSNFNDDPYTGIWKDEIVIPSGVIVMGEEFHVCMEDTNKGITLACYKLKNTEKQGPEKLTIDFNNFP